MLPPPTLALSVKLPGALPLTVTVFGLKLAAEEPSSDQVTQLSSIFDTQLA